MSSESSISYSTHDFIKLVKSNTLLWDKSHDDYLNRDKREDLWMHIAGELISDFHEENRQERLRLATTLSRHWKKMRGAFLRSYRTRQKNPDADTYPTYIYDQEMQFLLKLLPNYCPTPPPPPQTPEMNQNQNAILSRVVPLPARRLTRSTSIAQRPRHSVSFAPSPPRKDGAISIASDPREKRNNSIANQSQPASRNRRLEYRISPYRQIIQRHQQQNRRQNNDENGNCSYSSSNGEVEGDCLGFAEPDCDSDVETMNSEVTEEGPNDFDVKPTPNSLVATPPSPPPQSQSSASIEPIQMPRPMVIPSENQRLTRQRQHSTNPNPPMVTLPSSSYQSIEGNTTYRNKIAAEESLTSTTTKAPATTTTATTTTKITSPNSNAKETDVDQAFFDSIKPMIRNLDTNQKLDFQIEVLRLLRNARH